MIGRRCARSMRVNRRQSACRSINHTTWYPRNSNIFCQNIVYTFCHVTYLLFTSTSNKHIVKTFETSKMLRLKQWERVPCCKTLLTGECKNGPYRVLIKPTRRNWPVAQCGQVCERSGLEKLKHLLYGRAVWMLFGRRDRFSEKWRDIPMGIPI